MRSDWTTRFAAAVIVLGAWAALGVPAARAQTTSVAVDGVVREVPVVERQGRRFVALETIARLLGGRVESSDAERAVLTVDDSRLIVRRRLPYVEHDGRWYQMVDAAQKDANGFYLPASTLEHLLPVLWPGRFPAAVSPSSSSSSPSSFSSDLERIDVAVDPLRTRLAFRLRSTPGVVVDDARPGELRLDLSGVQLPHGAAAGLAGLGLVDSAAARPSSGGTRLTLWLDPSASVYAVSPLGRPAGLEIVLRSGPADEAAILLAADVGIDRPSAPPSDRHMPELVRRPPEAPEPRREPEPASEQEPRPEPHGEWTIVLDAGHGGHDPGAIGPGGTREKTVALAVTSALGKRLEAEGVRVILTRDGDEFIALEERTKIANRAGADLFVSIHANSAGRSAHGFETYFLSAARTEDAKRVARMENAAIRYEDPEIDPAALDDLNFILLDLAQNEYLRESSVLAETIQEEIGGRLSLRSRGVKQAGFLVLNGAYMPAILFEMAFISNPEEERLLKDRDFQGRLVDGLADGLLSYLDGYGRKILAANSGVTAAAR